MESFGENRVVISAGCGVQIDLQEFHRFFEDSAEFRILVDYYGMSQTIGE